MSFVFFLLAFIGISLAGYAPVLDLGGSALAAESKPGSKLKSLIDKAQAEGTLHLVWGENTFKGLGGARELVDAMNKHYGTNIQVEWAPGPSQPQMAAKLAQEFAAGVPATSDVYIGGSESYIATLAAPLMVLDQEDWTAYFDHVNPAAIAVDGAALQISARFPGIVYNNKLVPDNEAPKTLAAVLDPKWKGKVSTQPYVGYFDALSGPDLWGKEKTINYVEKLTQQISGLMRCGEYDRVVSGEFPIHLLACGEGGVLPYMEKGAPLSYVVPSDAAIMTHRYCGVPKNAKSPAAAKLFCAFLLTPEGQDFMWKVDRQDSEKIPGTHYYAKLKELEAAGVKPFDVSVEYVMSFPVLENAKELQNIVKLGARR